MKVITLTNEKGGVGKTTLTLHIAAGLAQRDRRVLIIDGDAQANCGRQLNIAKAGGLYRLLMQDAGWDDVLRVPEAARWAIPGAFPLTGSLTLLPSSHETGLIPLEVRNPLLLRERLAEVAQRFDVVIIDTPPSPALIHPLLYMACDGLIYVTECQELSLYGLKETAGRLRELDETREGYGMRRVKLLGVLPNKYQHTQAHMTGREILEQRFGKLVWESLPLRTIWQRREFEHQTLYAYAPGDVATHEIDGIVDKVAAYV